MSAAPHPATAAALHAARDVVLAAMAASNGTHAYHAALQALAAIPAGDLLGVAGLVACQLARPGETVLTVAEYAVLVGEP